MQLRNARMCLDCEEIHDQQECPVCGSESFAYISRWISTTERRQRPRAETTEQAETYRQLLSGGSSESQAWSAKRRWLTGGAFGLAAVSAAGWLWRRRSGDDDQSESAPVEKLASK
jgi:hypothetical protein